MELPKNITQIGEVDKTCKVYVEDYVVSYIKDLNRQAENKDISVALYGKHEIENGVDYHFIYGACKVDQLPKEVRHLSQAQQQEIERYRRKYFPELSFSGYRLLNGEMIEGFLINDRDVCRYIPGYAQFYEKNDAMLAYMLDVREAVQPEQVDQEKYERVKQRQEERRSAAEAADGNGVHTPSDPVRKIFQVPSTQNLQRMRLAAVAVFAVLCLFGIAAFKEQTADVAPQNDLVAVNAPVAEKDKLIIEDKLNEALQAENQSDMPQDVVEETKPSDAGGEMPQNPDADLQATADSETMAEQLPTTEPETTAEQLPAAEPEATAKQPVAAEPVATEPVAAEDVAYVIQPGDTLIAISRRQYGTDARVQDICERNKITDPDNIKQGQVLMLPR